MQRLRALAALKRAEACLVGAERGLLTALLAFMVALAFLQVALRQIGLRAGWSLSFLWGDTLLRHLVLWVGFLGAAVAAASDRQFAMDAAAQAFKGRKKAFIAAVCHAFAAFVCVGLARASWTYLAQERAHGGILFTILGRDARTWWFESVAPFGFVLLLVHYALKAVEAAHEGLWPSEAPAAPSEAPAAPSAAPPASSETSATAQPENGP